MAAGTPTQDRHPGLKDTLDDIPAIADAKMADTLSSAPSIQVGCAEAPPGWYFPCKATAKRVSTAVQPLHAPSALERPAADLKASTNCVLPTRGAPNVMHRTSAVGHCRPAQQAARVATAPPMQ